MTTEYPFVGRKTELEDLQKAFTDKVIKEHRCLAYLVEGRKGTGKTRLIDEFIGSISINKHLHAQIPAFDERKHVIRYQCAESEGKAYQPFESITNQLQKWQKVRFILVKLGMVVLAIFNVDTIFTYLKAIWDSLFHPSSSPSPDTNWLQFLKYRKLVIGFNRKAPLIIFIQNVENIDPPSLELLENLMLGAQPLWGVIIIEEDQYPEEPEIQLSLARMVRNGILSRLTLWNLGKKEFPSNMLSPVFGIGFFDGTEMEIMYAVSEGCPGLLVEYIELWKGNRWITRVAQGWSKDPNFRENIKPKEQKLLELIIALFEDRTLTEGEEHMIYRMAADWGIPKDVISRTIDMARDIYGCKYRLVRRLGTGVVSADSFEARDEKDNHCIIEYFRSERKVALMPRHRDVVHSNLFEAKEIRSTTNGFLIYWEYRDWVRIKEIMREAREKQVERARTIMEAITPAVAELHRVAEVHGFIQPASILEGPDRQYYIASFDSSMLGIMPPELRLNPNAIPYLAPEVLSGGKDDPRADVFSLGAVLHNLLTNRPPFEGNSLEALIAKMKEPLIFSEGMVASIPSAYQPIVKKCLEFHPDNRYRDADEFLADLKTIQPSPPPQPPPPPPSGRSRKLPAAIAAVIVLSAAAFFLRGLFLSSSVPPIDVMTIAISEGKGSSQSQKPIPAREVQFLIMDDLTQSSDLHVLSETMFSNIYPVGSIPRLALKGEIVSEKFQIRLHVSCRTSNGDQKDTTLTFVDPSTLLRWKSLITGMVLKTINAGAATQSKFTDSWDAFESFFAGQTAWRRLDVTNAMSGYNSALDIDSTFALAMIRLADVCRFDGQRTRALSLLARANPYLGTLGEADSLGAVALELRLSGHLWDAVKIYRQIKDKLPGRRSAVFDVAETYYELREIDEAVTEYRQVLLLDPEFAPAFNHLGYCYSHLGMHDSALACFRQYVRLDSTANAYDSMGDGYFAAGKLDSAAWAKNLGIARDPGLGYLYSALAYIDIRAGRLKDAEQNINKYENYAGSNRDLLPTGLAASAYLSMVNHDFRSCIRICREGLRMFDSKELGTRNHQLHWLLGVASLQAGQGSTAQKELDTMNQIINANGVSERRYNEILKFKYHLQALLDAGAGRSDGVIAAVRSFNDSLKLRSKVKDGGSAFDLAFLNTSLGGMLLQPRLLDVMEAERMFKAALAFNPHYAGAHYSLSKLYKMTLRTNESNAEMAKFSEEWRHADSPSVIPEGGITPPK